MTQRIEPIQPTPAPRDNRTVTIHQICNVDSDISDAVKNAVIDRLTTYLRSARKNDLTRTDIYQRFQLERTVLEQRIEGTEGKWKAHWQREHQTLLRCLWALDNA